MGAGGTAHGLGFVLNQAGAKVTFVNRTDVKAKNIANLFLAQWRSFSELKKIKKDDYDILIHTTSVGMKDKTVSLVPSNILYPGKIVLDVVFNDTKLIQSAKEKKCVAYNGIDFWVDQAALQFRLWHGLEASATKEKMKKKF